MTARTLAILCIAALSLPLLSGCGDDDGGDAASDSSRVAVRTPGSTITEADVARSLPVVWPMSEDLGGAQTRPPRYTACVKAQKKAQGGNDVTLLRARCEEVYGEHEQVTVRTLIIQAWAKRAAEERGLEPAGTAIDRLVDKQTQEFAPALATRLDASASLRRKLRATVLDQERNRRLAKAFDTTTSELPIALAERYGQRTRCVGKYDGVPECGGRSG